MSKIAIIGNGNVGFHLAKALSKHHNISVFSRNPKEKHINEFSSLQPEGSDFIFLTVPDDHVKQVSDSIESSEAILIHTSGSRPLTDLEKHEKRGVLYPLQTFSKHKNIDFENIQLFVEGTEETEKIISELAKSISERVRILNSIDRSKLHLAAVFACNFSNHMFHIAEDILQEINLSFKDIRSLVEETLEKAMEINPSNAQTGPAIRNDVSTLAKHEGLIEDDAIKDLYQLISRSIQTRQ